MSANVEKAVAIKTTRGQIEVVDFDGERLKAPFLLRCGALLIDYMLVILAPVSSILIGRFMGVNDAKLVNGTFNSTGWMIALLIAVTNFVILPMFFGQSIGKIFTGLRIIKSDGRPLNFRSALMRNVVGYLITAATGGLGFLFATVNSKGRAVHDFVGGTIVVHAQRRPKVLKS